MRRPAPLLALLIALVAGCGTAPKRGSTVQNGTPTTTVVETGTRTYTLTSTAERRMAVEFVFHPSSKVWAALPAAYAAAGVTAAGVVTQDAAFGNPGLRVVNGRLAGSRAGEFLDCGHSPIGVPAANSYALQVSLVTTLEPTRSDETRITTQLKATAEPRTGGSPTTCTTLGTLEKRIHDEILARLQP